MDALRFAEAKETVGNWLPQLTLRQRDELRALLGTRDALRMCLQWIEAARPVQCCPHCGAGRFHRYGMLGDLQRYRCLACRRTFNALTNTPLAHLRLRAKWLAYLQCMLMSDTVRAAATLVGIHRNTSFRWRHRFLAEAKHDRPATLHGIVEADETYQLESQKGSRHLDRPARRRGGVASTRGITHQHDCILVARDRGKRTRDFVAGRGPITCDKLEACLPTVLAAPEAGPRVLLVTDSAPAYFTFARKSGISHAAVNLRAGIRVHGRIHVQNVNAYHREFKGWLHRFRGVASRYLANYLGWLHGLASRRFHSAQRLLVAALCGAAAEQVWKEIPLRGDLANGPRPGRARGRPAG